MIQKKMTINATDDSYDKARQSMAQAEEETRSRGTIVIKNGGRYQGRDRGERSRGHSVCMHGYTTNCSYGLETLVLISKKTQLAMLHLLPWQRV